MKISSTKMINITLSQDEAVKLVKSVNDVYKDVVANDKKKEENIDELLFFKDSIVRELAK